MNRSVRSLTTAGIALITAVALVFVPSVTEPSRAARDAHTVATVRVAAHPIQLAAAVQQAQPPLLTILLNSPELLLGLHQRQERCPLHQLRISLAIAPNLADTIDNVYIAVEPWVQYGFQVATAIVAWIPFVGWFAGQIMVFYTFFEGKIASGVFNFTDWLRGDGGAIENLVDFGIDVGLAWVWLGLDELAQFIPLPPFCCYPPRPPVQGPFLALDTALAPTETSPGVANAANGVVGDLYTPVRDTIDAGVNVLQAALAPIPVVSIFGDQVNLLYDFLVEPIADSVVFDLIDPVLNAPLDINSYVDGVFNVGAAVVNSLTSTGIAELNYVLDTPLSSPIDAEMNSPRQIGQTAINPIPEALFAPEMRAFTVEQGDVDAGAQLGGTAKDALTEGAETAATLSEEPAETFAGGEQSVPGDGSVALQEVADTDSFADDEALAEGNSGTERHEDENDELAEDSVTSGEGLVRAQGKVRSGLKASAHENADENAGEETSSGNNSVRDDDTTQSTDNSASTSGHVSADPTDNNKNNNKNNNNKKNNKNDNDNDAGQE